MSHTKLVANYLPQIEIKRRSKEKGGDNTRRDYRSWSELRTSLKRATVKMDCGSSRLLEEPLKCVSDPDAG